MLNIAEVEALLLQLLLGLDELFRLCIELALEFVHVGVEHLKALLQVIDLLLLGEDLLLISLNIVEENSLLTITPTLGGD